MTSLTLFLVITAAFLHATWNILAKKVSGGVIFTLLISVVQMIVYAPLMLWVVTTQPIHIGFLELFFIFGTAVLHLVYFLLLQQAYRVGDISLVYPLARGSGPMLSSLVAVLFLGEHLGGLAACGVVMIGLGVILLAGSPQRLWRSKAKHAIIYGLLTGLTIASYTLWDKCAVSRAKIHPVVYNWGEAPFQILILLPWVLPQWKKIGKQWKTHYREAIGIAALSPLAYIMILTAFVFSPVSRVAPAREISMLIGTFAGGKLLAEKELGRRLMGATVMVLGVFALAVG